MDTVIFLNFVTTNLNEISSHYSRRQPNLATLPTHTNINRHSQESGLFLRPPYMQLDRLVSSYCSSAYYHLRTINNIRHLLTLDACHAAVRSLVLSRLDYCNALLGGLNNRQLDRLQRVQNSAARVVYRVRQHDHITPALRTLHWLPIRMRISFKICTYMFKAIHGLGPEYINCVVERYMPVRALRSSCNGILLKVTVPKKTIGQSSFAVAGPQMWNDLPIDVLNFSP